MASFDGPAVARAGSGVCYGYFERAPSRRGVAGRTQARAACKAVIEFAPEPRSSDARPVAVAGRRFGVDEAGQASV